MSGCKVTINVPEKAKKAFKEGKIGKKVNLTLSNNDKVEVTVCDISELFNYAK